MSKQTFLIVDIEATCWADEDPDKGEMEMIELGVVHVDARGHKLDSFTTLIRPEYSKVSDYCTKLLGVTHAELDDERSLRQVMEHFECWLDGLPNEPIAWYSWGAWDRKQIAFDCARKRIGNPLQMEHRDAKKLFQKKQLPGKKRVGARKALELMGMTFTGKHHQALNDALNVARLMPFFHVAPDGLDYDCMIDEAWLLSFEKLTEPIRDARILTGLIIKDHKGRFPAGRVFRSSPVQKTEGDLVTTMNTVYKCEGGFREIELPITALPFIMDGYPPPVAILLADGKLQPVDEDEIN